MIQQTVYNPVAKDKVTFLKSGEDTNGAYELVEVELAPGGGVMLHYHTNFIEEFEPVTGALGIELDGKILIIIPGQTAIAPINSFYNPSDHETIIFQTYIKPARNFEKTLRIGYGLASDGKVNKKGAPSNIWHLALLFRYSESYLPGLPLFFQKKIFGLLASIATKLGKEKELEKFWIAEKVISEDNFFNTPETIA